MLQGTEGKEKRGNNEGLSGQDDRVHRWRSERKALNDSTCLRADAAAYCSYVIGNKLARLARRSGEDARSASVAYSAQPAGERRVSADLEHHSHGRQAN